MNAAALARTSSRFSDALISSLNSAIRASISGALTSTETGKRGELSSETASGTSGGTLALSGHIAAIIAAGNRVSGTRSLCRAQLFDDAHARAGADARGPGGNHALQVGQRANATRGLDPDPSFDGLVEQADIFNGGSARAKSCGGLHEI